MIGDIFNLLLLRPMLNVLLLLYSLLHTALPGAAFALAIAALTVVLRLATQPFMAKQMQSSKRMAELQPQLKEIEKKYGKDRERMAQEQMKLYKEHGINPMAGCLPMLLQFPIWIALYQSIIQLLGRTPAQLLAVSKHVYSLGIFGNLATLFPLASRFLWLDLGRPDPYYIIPILVAATQWVQQKMMAPASPGGNDSQAQMSQSMLMMMPLMFGFITINLASGLGVYFIISSLVSIVLQYFTTGWGGLRPQRATAAAAKGGAQERPAPSILSAAKRLMSPAGRDGEAKPATATNADNATTQPAASAAKGGATGERPVEAPGHRAPAAASLQKGTKHGSRKKKR
ncbi:MAG TPA: YidC/Oxa1 family membrane protein insertase [Anaerolineae bacterium]|nr:YidC/Oxa1 family membrane protein insertase [Anaerolineae bacterium]HOQ99157.1 YidC/Oxa1 family membrane protein insertase [Anaerolineae bacterium]HPL29959.1 YidC/Oxa1 family membrane protein insertase [Anaerolineae bacterium]